MLSETTKLSGGHRLVIPATIRKVLGLHVGDALTWVLDDTGELRMVPHPKAVIQAQDLLRRHIPTGDSLVRELFADRLKDAAIE